MSSAESDEGLSWSAMSGPRLWNRIAEAMELSGLKGDIGSLEERSGVAGRTLRRWREGKNDDAKLSSLEAVAGALGVSVGWLVADPSAAAPTPIADPRLTPARDHATRLRQEAESLLRLLSPVSPPFEQKGPRITLADEPTSRKQAKDPKENLVWFPIVGERIAAGLGSMPEAGSGHMLSFRESWAVLSYPKDERRYCLAFLGDESIADSMDPDIKPRSMLLLDRDEGSRIEIQEGKPYLCVVDESTDEPALAVKYVKPVYDGSQLSALRLISANGEKYEPKVIRLEEGRRIQDYVRARVVWWATTA